ncbi:LysR family transcriptional regulator [Bradyrhizobium sp. AS23.2]|uniref:LysR family transcriptional regulator n=1 Tax=Bradyrhizobium sp. AS23.2 TaxID=1680155 RepID=UPI0009394232|nr:LysR family transcriptional regulator [Bradyrhizobium sp. AS23.2]
MAAPALKKTIAKLDLLSLRLFLTVCEEQSILRAAQRERIAPSATSKRIQEIEYLFGVKLLYRNAKGTVPTPVGQVLADHAREIFHLIDKVRTDLSEFAEGIKGHVRVAAIPSALVGSLAPHLKEFSDAYPSVDLDIREHLSPEVVHAVATGIADIGVFATPPEIADEIGSFAYKRDELMAFLPEDHPLAARRSAGFAELLDIDLIGVHVNSSVTNQLRRAAADLGRQLNLRFQVQTNEVAKSMVAAGFGAMIQPSGLVTNATHDRIVALPLSEDWAKREVRVCVRRGAVLPAQVQAVFDFLLGQASDKGREQSVQQGVLEITSA